eukprot:m.184707 g.184707  ORF g.184707 m.184707 type:complete len:523 (-) comp10511_c0_seq7:827-2395(-)
MDRNIRLWNPFVNSQCAAELVGHISPIVALALDDPANRLISLSTDAEIRIWDLVSYQCVQALSYRLHKIRGEIHTMIFHPVARVLAVAHAETISYLQFSHAVKGSDDGCAHPKPIRNILYNKRFRQIVTGCSSGLIKVWDMDTGRHSSEFSVREPTRVGEVPNEDELVLSTMTLDHTGCRLITCSPKGTINLWNVSNGQRLNVMSTGDGCEIMTAIHVSQKRHRMIFCGGSTRKVYTFKDVLGDVHLTRYPEDDGWDQSEGPEDDVIALDFCAPNLLASASYDGEIIVWNINSTHVVCRLRPRTRMVRRSSFSVPAAVMDMMRESAVFSLLFLPSRHGIADAVSLVSGGVDGNISFWNVMNGGALGASMQVSKGGVFVPTLATDEKERFLVCGDSTGKLYVWDIRNYLVGNPHRRFSGHFHLEESDEMPLQRAKWTAHNGVVSTLKLITEQDSTYAVVLDSICSCLLLTHSMMVQDYLFGRSRLPCRCFHARRDAHLGARSCSGDRRRARAYGIGQASLRIG